jgi:hypothetical protein
MRIPEKNEKSYRRKNFMVGMYLILNLVLIPKILDISSQLTDLIPGTIRVTSCPN